MSNQVGDPRDYKWITVSFLRGTFNRIALMACLQTSQIEKMYEQMSIAVDRDATRLWIINVGDMKPYEREIEFLLSYGWNATRWSPENLNNFVSAWAQREFDVDDKTAAQVTNIVANLTRFNARRKPELLNATTYSVTDYRE
jgi:hypothetical protein